MLIAFPIECSRTKKMAATPTAMNRTPVHKSFGLRSNIPTCFLPLAGGTPAIEFTVRNTFTVISSIARHEAFYR